MVNPLKPTVPVVAALFVAVGCSAERVDGSPAQSAELSVLVESFRATPSAQREDWIRNNSPAIQALGPDDGEALIGAVRDIVAQDFQGVGHGMGYASGSASGSGSSSGGYCSYYSCSPVPVVGSLQCALHFCTFGCSLIGSCNDP